MYFKRFFSVDPATKIARQIYALIVAKARQPHFYAELRVPDTVDGRFDMIALHAILLMNRLAQGGPKAKMVSQKVFDEMFADMDRSLREMGAGDLSVGKKVRKMAEVFYGRAAAYRGPLARQDLVSLGAALARNVYGGTADPPLVSRLATYAGAATELLRGQTEADLISGRVFFPQAETF